MVGNGENDFITDAPLGFLYLILLSPTFSRLLNVLIFRFGGKLCCIRDYPVSSILTTNILNCFVFVVRYVGDRMELYECL